MNQLMITSPFSGGVTLIPNHFIEHYMIHANGEFVKVYLYLLRGSERLEDLSLGRIADALSCTESDVFRALKYWEKEGLLTMQPPNSRKPEVIQLIFPAAPVIDKSSADKIVSTESESDKSVSAERSSGKSVPLAESSANTGTGSDTKKGQLTPDKVKQLKENESIAELLFIAQKYMGKTLSPMETNRILYFYDGLGFSTDLIEYLIEYCVSKGHKSINYIEKVAIAWKEDGITDAEAAKKASETNHKDYYTILKALGIRGRAPIEAEISIMRTWLFEYKFSLDVVLEACTRTILATRQPSFQYADRILRSWSDAGVHSLADIQKQDAVHEQTKTGKTRSKTAKQATRFSNFEQRSYDYEALERELLKR